MSTPTDKQAAVEAALRELLAIIRADAERGFHPTRRVNEAMLRADAALLAEPRSEGVKDGWVMVPREPTAKMICAADEAGWSGYTGTWTIAPDKCWRAMLAAAPSPEPRNK